jgi:hypothetical protein
MSRTVQFGKVILHMKNIACAQSCRFCLSGPKKIARVPAARFFAIVTRFLEWQEQQQEPYIPIYYTLGYAFNYDRDTVQRICDLGKRFPRSAPRRAFSLGGLPQRTDDELRRWLQMQKSFGIEAVHATIAGTESLHDFWSGRKGTFDLLTRTLRVAGELGLTRSHRLLIVRSTLPCLRELCQYLDNQPPGIHDDRYAMPIYYAGFGSRLEDERITEAERDELRSWLSAEARGPEKWLSEREWIRQIEADEAPDRVSLHLEINDDNVAWYESSSCEEIMESMMARTLAAYASLPPCQELCLAYGERDGKKIYGQRDCLERKWLDLHLQSHPLSFERDLTHLANRD